MITIEIEPETVAKIASISSSHDCSVSTFLMTCWQVLLSRFTGQPDIVVGAVSDGRTDDELEYSLGLMTKYLPLVFSSGRGLAIQRGNEAGRGGNA